MGKLRRERLGHGEERSGAGEVMRVEPHVVRSSGVGAQETAEKWVRGYSPNTGTITGL